VHSSNEPDEFSQWSRRYDSTINIGDYYQWHYYWSFTPAAVLTKPYYEKLHSLGVRNIMAKMFKFKYHLLTHMPLSATHSKDIFWHRF